MPMTEPTIAAAKGPIAISAIAPMATPPASVAF